MHSLPLHYQHQIVSFVPRLGPYLDGVGTGITSVAGGIVIKPRSRYTGIEPIHISTVGKSPSQVVQEAQTRLCEIRDEIRNKHAQR